MIRRLLTAAVSVLLLAGSLSAEPVQTVLTPDNTVYAIHAIGELPLLEITRKQGTVAETLIVPSTEDEAVESHPRLLWDNKERVLYVVWHRAGVDSDDIRIVSLKNGQWSQPLTVSSCTTAKRAGLQVALTRSLYSQVIDDAPTPTTLVHIGWWTLAPETQKAEYALVAFSRGEHVSTDVDGLLELALLRESGEGESGPGEFGGDEELGALHPPLAISARNGDEVEVVFGAPDTTRLTLVRLRPKKIGGDVRIWKPGRTLARNLPKASLISSDGAPVQSFLSNGRVVLYTPEKQFRFAVYENNAWSPTRMIQLDEKLTGDELLHYLRNTVEEQEAMEEGDGSTNE